MSKGEEMSDDSRTYWVSARFKGKTKVFALCDKEGNFRVQSGRIPFKYKMAQDNTYAAAQANLTPEPGAEVVSHEASVMASLALGKKASPRKATPPPAAVPRPGGVEAVVVYTDGACSGNPGPAGSGVLLSYQGKDREISHYLGIATNNIAELYAVKLALEALASKSVPVDLYTDSTYVIGVLQKGWKAKENVELIGEIRRLLATFKDVRLHKVKGHAGVGPNERVDELAREAVERRR
jgi:ribonuclease HI